MRVFSVDFGLRSRDFELFKFRQHIVGADQIRIELDLHRGVGRTNFADALELAFPHRIGDRQALEERFKRHLFVHFDEDMFISSKRITGFPHLILHLCDQTRAEKCCGIQRSNHPVSK